MFVSPVHTSIYIHMCTSCVDYQELNSSAEISTVFRSIHLFSTETDKHL